LTALLHHVSTRDHEVRDADLAEGLAVLRRIRDVLPSCGGVYDEKDEMRGTRSATARGRNGLSIMHHEATDTTLMHPTRSLTITEQAEGTRHFFRVESCATTYGAIDPDDHEIGILQLVDLLEAALTIAPSTRGHLDARLQTAMDGLAWASPDRQEGSPLADMPWMWLAASPVRPMRLNGTDLAQDLHVPRICCLRVSSTHEGLRMNLTGFAGHTIWKRMDAVTGLRAMLTLEEWRREDSGSSEPLGRAA
jgi:hypothetical protein